MSDKDEDVFVDAVNNTEEDETPRRTSRKRRSTAGSVSSTKKAKAAKMPLLKSPTMDAANPGSKAKKVSAASPAARPTQAAAAGSGDDFWVKMNSMLGGTEARMTTMISGTEARLKAESAGVRQALEEKLGGVTAAVEGLKSRMASQEDRLSSLEGNMYDLIDQRIDAKLTGCNATTAPGGGYESEDSVEEIVEKAWGSPKGPSYASVVQARAGPQIAKIDPARRREEAYWMCRRSLRIRPVNDGNNLKALESYLRDHLKMSRSAVAALGLERVTTERVPYGPKSKNQKEMIVRFSTTEARDVVKSSARNLAGLGSDYGVRLEVPGHLKSAMQAVQAVSYDIKKKYPGARRNVLYDDGSQDLVLDFCTAEGQSWKRVTAKQARQAKAKGKLTGGDNGRRLEDGELDEILEGGEGRGEEEVEDP